MTNEYISIKLTLRCNFNCIFCAEPKKDFDEDFNRIKYILEKAYKNGTRRLILTGGEPTLYNKLFDVIEFAENLGYEYVLVVTNGYLLSNLEFAKKFLKFNIVEFQISFFALNPITFDRLTGLDGSFLKVIKALFILRKLNQKIAINCIISKLNYKELKYLMNIFHIIQPVRIIFSALNYINMADKNKDILKISYSEIKKELKKTILFAKKLNIKAQILFHNINFCIFKDDFEFFKPYLYDLHLKKDQKDIYNMINKTKLESCKQCKYNEYCYGILKRYIELFGNSEFQPIKKQS